MLKTQIGELKNALSPIKEIIEENNIVLDLAEQPAFRAIEPIIIQMGLDAIFEGEEVSVKFIAKELLDILKGFRTKKDVVELSVENREEKICLILKVRDEEHIIKCEILPKVKQKQSQDIQRICELQPLFIKDYLRTIKDDEDRLLKGEYLSNLVVSNGKAKFFNFNYLKNRCVYLVAEANKDISLHLTPEVEKLEVLYKIIKTTTQELALDYQKGYLSFGNSRYVIYIPCKEYEFIIEDPKLNDLHFEGITQATNNELYSKIKKEEDISYFYNSRRATEKVKNNFQVHFDIIESAEVAKTDKVVAFRYHNKSEELLIIS